MSCFLSSLWLKRGDIRNKRFYLFAAIKGPQIEQNLLQMLFTVKGK